MTTTELLLHALELAESGTRVTVVGDTAEHAAQMADSAMMLFVDSRSVRENKCCVSVGRAVITFSPVPKQFDWDTKAVPGMNVTFLLDDRVYETRIAQLESKKDN